MYIKLVVTLELKASTSNSKLLSELSPSGVYIMSLESNVECISYKDQHLGAVVEKLR